MPIVQSSHAFFDNLVADEMPCATIDLQSLRIQEFVWRTRIRESSTVYEPMPWQRGIYAFIFGAPPKRPLLSLPVGPYPLTRVTAASPQPLPHVSAPAPNFAKQRLRLVSLLKTDDATRWEALRKVRVLVLVNPQSTELGKRLLAEAAPLKDEGRLQKSFQDVFISRATATLAKRASALWRFAAWCVNNGYGNPLEASESTLYSYTLHLEEIAKPTAPFSFLQAWKFVHHILKFTSPASVEAVSARVKGAAQRAFQLKRPLIQAEPLKVKAVKALEYVVLKAPYAHWIIIGSHLLLCLGSSSRFGDTQVLGKLTLTSAQNVVLIEAESKRWKTGNAASRRAQLLPLCSLGQFFADQPWGPAWFDIRTKHGLSLSPALPAWSESESKWLQRPMSTGEASLYMKEFLCAAGLRDLEGIGCHSLKCTVLSWAAKSTAVSLADRRLLGHHIDPGVASPLTYARDEQTRLTVIVHGLVAEIRRGHFKPDAEKVWCLAVLIRSGESETLAECVHERAPDMPVSDCEQDDLDEEDLRADASVLSVNSGPKTAAAVQAIQNCRMHTHSRVVHILKDSTRFLCSRNNTGNYEPVDNEVPLCDLPVCVQCSRAAP